MSDVEHVVINGGSSVETKDFLASYKGISISESDKGISDAFNKGLKLSSREAILFLNSGDLLIDQNYIKDAVSVLEKLPEIDFIHADIFYKDSIAGKIHLQPRGTFPSMPVMHPTLIVRRRVFEKVGGFDLNFKSAMDLDFVMRMFLVGCKGHYIPRPVVEMDGCGISSSKPYLGFKEKILAVHKNKLWSICTILKLLKTFLMLNTRLTILFLGGSKVISWYRKRGYSN